MMLVLRKGTDEQGVRKLVKHIEASGADVQYINGEQMMLGLSGDTSQLNPDSLSRFEEAERIIKVPDEISDAGVLPQERRRDERAVSRLRGSL